MSVTLSRRLDLQVQHALDDIVDGVEADDVFPGEPCVQAVAAGQQDHDDLVHSKAQAVAEVHVRIGLVRRDARDLTDDLLNLVQHRVVDSWRPYFLGHCYIPFLSEGYNLDIITFIYTVVDCSEVWYKYSCIINHVENLVVRVQCKTNPRLRHSKKEPIWQINQKDCESASV